MSDPKIHENDNEELLLDSWESDEALVENDEAELEDVFFADDDQSDGQEQQEQGASTEGYRHWLHAAVALGALAFLLVALLSPIVNRHEQRIAVTPEIINLTDIVNLSAAQSLTVAGDFNRVNAEKEQLSGLLSELFGQQDVFASMAQMIFGSKGGFEQVSNAVTEYTAEVDAFVAYQVPVSVIKQGLVSFNQEVTTLSANSLQFVEAVAKEGRNKSSAETKDRYLFLTSEAARLNGLVSKLSEESAGLLNINNSPEKTVDSLNSYYHQFVDTLDRVVGNSAEIVAAESQPMRENINGVSAQIEQLTTNVEQLTKAKNTIFSMQGKAEALKSNLNQTYNRSAAFDTLKSLLAILPILLVALAVYCLWRFFKGQGSRLADQEVVLTEALEGQQESILKLLDEMSALADGDLTVEAEVTDQVTGAIADSVNFAVIEMRDLVSQINRASLQVAGESKKAVSSAELVSESNMSQSNEISQAAEQMVQAAANIRKMAENASSSSSMASESMQVATKGAQAVRDTIKGMDDMREQIQDTSKRIKRLGESSQRIGEIVALIDDIAEQTNILSLNAAIQASMAGEAGRGFAVVSDEVQSLAERSTEATKKIAELVTLIQTDTNDAMQSMERATQEVVNGTKVVDVAGTSLADIESVSQQLSLLVANIAQESTEQADVVTSVSQQVSKVKENSILTSAKANESAQSISNLLELASELETSISRFKLPSS